MKLLLISDLHTTANKQKLILKNADYDIICRLGDNDESDLDIIIVNAKVVPILGVLGNHDLLSLYDNFPSINHINNKLFTENNLPFIGVDGSLRYKDNPNIAMRTREEYDKIINNLPVAYILLNHTGPIKASY